MNGSVLDIYNLVLAWGDVISAPRMRDGNIVYIDVTPRGYSIFAARGFILSPEGCDEHTKS